MSKADYEFIPSNGGLKFSIEGHGEKHWVIISEELLDDEVGDSASDEERREWVEKNINTICDAFEAKTKGGIIQQPFDRIVVRRGN